MSGSIWDRMPSHQKHKPHLIEDIHFDPEMGGDSWVRCDCGWLDTEPTHGKIERAYVEHRRSLGLPASIMTFKTPLGKALMEP